VGGSMLGGYFSRLNGHSNLITFDMGGTTAKASLIHDGQVPVAREFEVGRIDRFRRGSGFPVRTPAIDMEEIGAGGGSIASIDRLSQIQVGPRSAGADPGPACYGLGGTEPTVTDADLVLGYLDPDYFLGGEMRLDRDAAAGAIEEKIARPLGLHLVEAAWGIHRVVNEEMANAFRIHALEHGRDAARYALLCFGGAGPVHAYGVGQILRSPAIISPASAGVASALGFLVAPVAADFVRSYIARLDRIDWGHLNDLLEGLEARGRAFLATAGIHDAAIRVSRSADMQHVGQMHDIPITVPLGKLGPENENELQQGFLTRYRELFQRTVSRVPVEALTWRVTLSAPPPEINLRRRAPRDGAGARKGERLAYFAGLDDFLPTAVYDRYALQPGDSFPGPAIVEERESTLVVGPATQVSMDDYGSLLVETGVTA
jgi:N-methylhydantoinase A